MVSNTYTNTGLVPYHYLLLFFLISITHTFSGMETEVPSEKKFEPYFELIPSYTEINPIAAPFNFILTNHFEQNKKRMFSFNKSYGTHSYPNDYSSSIIISYNEDKSLKLSITHSASSRVRPSIKIVLESESNTYEIMVYTVFMGIALKHQNESYNNKDMLQFIQNINTFIKGQKNPSFVYQDFTLLFNILIKAIDIFSKKETTGPLLAETASGIINELQTAFNSAKEQTPVDQHPLPELFDSSIQTMLTEYIAHTDIVRVTDKNSNVYFQTALYRMLSTTLLKKDVEYKEPVKSLPKRTPPPSFWKKNKMNILFGIGVSGIALSIILFNYRHKLAPYLPSFFNLK